MDRIEDEDGLGEDQTVMEIQRVLDRLANCTNRLEKLLKQMDGAQADLKLEGLRLDALRIELVRREFGRKLEGLS